MLFGVNIDHVATIRQARKTPYPDLLHAAHEAEAGGADFITVHLREDRRHIIDTDLPVLSRGIKTFINLEIAATDEMQKVAISVMPKKICLVPERRAELTTEGGLNVRAQSSRLQEFIAPLTQAGIEVSFFVDPNELQVRAAAESGAVAVELHTGDYAENGDVTALRQAAEAAAELGLKVHAGHGLRTDNVAPVASLPMISELNIGHAIVARALFIGLRAAVQEMADAIRQARSE